MTRSRIRNRNNELRDDENWKAFIVHWNECRKLLCKYKNSYHYNLNVKSLKDNRKSWIIFKPLVSDKVQTSIANTILENDGLDNDERFVLNF